MKKDFLEALEKVDNFTETENGAIALNSTRNYLLDAFGSLGAMMHDPVESIVSRFSKAFLYDKKNAMKLLFYMRDIRGGQGQRRVFRICLRWLANNYPDYVKNNLDNILFFGRGDDYLCLFDTPVEEDMLKEIAKILVEDNESVRNGGYPSMLAKWLPSENASSEETKYYATRMIIGLEITNKTYRKTLSHLRKEIGIVESLMSQNKWEEIKFDKLPSRASMIYTDAFVRHQKERYLNYLKSLADGEVGVNANVLFPVDIVHKVDQTFSVWGPSGGSVSKKILYNAMWEALPNYFGDNEETGICVVDTSGSMAGTPIEVALSLGLYCADKAKGPFKDHFITFSNKPKLQKIKGDNIVEKLRSMTDAGWDMNTNIEAVFDLILETAIANDLPQEDLPSKLYIISDMQFDAAASFGAYWQKKPLTFMGAMRKKFEEAGYRLPNIVYWNVRESDCGMFQQEFDGEDCCMVGGYSATLFRDVINGTKYVEEVNEKGEKVVREKLDPITIMMTTLNNERYNRVWA